MENQKRPTGSVLTAYISDCVRSTYNQINRGYEAGRTIAFNTRRLKEREGSNSCLKYSHALLREVERITYDTKAVNLGFQLYRFLNHFDCKIIDRNVNSAEEYIKNNTISEKDMCDELKKESIVMLADTHCFSRHRKKMIEIIKNINRENLAVGLETFGTDMQRHIDDYMHSRISLEKFVSMTRYSERELKKYGYVNLLEFLKESNIKTIGVDMPNFIVKSTTAEASISVFINEIYLMIPVLIGFKKVHPFLIILIAYEPTFRERASIV